MRRRCSGEAGNRLARFVRHVNADGVTDLAGLVVSCGRTRHGNEPVAEHARGARRSRPRYSLQVAFQYQDCVRRGTCSRSLGSPASDNPLSVRG
jgi:hypothetical protein